MCMEFFKLHFDEFIRCVEFMCTDFTLSKNIFVERNYSSTKKFVSYISSGDSYTVWLMIPEIWYMAIAWPELKASRNHRQYLLLFAKI